MDTGLSSPEQVRRVQPRHELRTLTYICLDQGNGGIVRDISHEGIGAQVVAAVRPRQQLRVRFELSRPRLRVETRGEVSWATRSGQCGIRFLDLSPKTAHKINEWIFGNMLEEAARHFEREGSIFAGTLIAGTPLAGTALDATALDGTALSRTASAGRALAGKALAGSPVVLPDAVEVQEDEIQKDEIQEDDIQEDHGLMISAAPVHIIQLPARPDPQEAAGISNVAASSQSLSSLAPAASAHFDWLSQPLSGRGLIWTINTLVLVAALLLFALVFLSVTGEPPRWPLTTASAAAVFVAALYWGFFRVFGGSSPGTRLARMAGLDLDESDEVESARFR